MSLNPKNLAPTLSATRTIEGAPRGPGGSTAALLTVIVFGAAGVAAPGLVLLSLDEHAEAILTTWRARLSAHAQAVVISVLLTVRVLLTVSAALARRI